MHIVLQPNQPRTRTHFMWLCLFLVVGMDSIAEPNVTREVISARARIKLVRSPEIQSELSIDPQQLQAIDKVVDQVDLPLWQLRDLTLEQSNPLGSPLNKQLKDGLAGILRPEQNKRLDQLVLRWDGWRTLQLPSVVDQLDLTNPQKDKYAELISGFQNLEGKTLQAIGLSEYEWIRRCLTVAQREKLKALLGQPYDFSRCKILEVKAPEIAGVDQWINSAPLKLEQLKGKVVIVNFWTFGCINCIRNLPHYRKWFTQLPRDQVVMIAFHTPETQGEYDLDKLKQAVKEKKLQYPIAVDNRKENWKAWGNNMWPSTYLIDKQGYVRNWWYGELNWQGAAGEKQMLDKIYQLLAEKESKGPSNP